jgi:NAD(P)-dependent dehydrogenase (short-subunit alcohol dehydrogenase family)
MTLSPEIEELAVVTGASTGIGAATARELARRGFHVLAGVRRDRDGEAIRGPGIEPVIIDVTNRATSRRWRIGCAGIRRAAH